LNLVMYSFRAVMSVLQLVKMIVVKS